MAAGALSAPGIVAVAPGSRTPWWLWLHGLLTYVFLYLPIVVLVVYSFSNSQFSTVWGGFSTKWYESLWEDEKRLGALKNSLWLGLISTGIGTVLGTLAALGVARLRQSGQRWFEAFFFLPIMVPDIVIALSLRVYFLKIWEAKLGMGLMILAHSVLSVCFVFMVVNTRLKGFDWRLVEAAKDLGANAWGTFRHLMLPLLWPGIVGGMLLAFAVSLDDFVLSSFLSGPGGGTLPMNIQGAIKRDFTPSINALATLMLAVSIGLALLSVLVQRRGRSH